MIYGTIILRWQYYLPSLKRVSSDSPVMLSTPSSDNKSSKLYIRVVVVGIVTALHGLLLYLFFQYQTALKIKPQTTQPLEISFIQLKPHPSQTYHSQIQPVVIHHADPAKQAYPSDNTQAADIKQKPLSKPNPPPAKLVNHPAKDNTHKPIERRPTIDNSTNQKKASQLTTPLSTASQSQSQTQPQKKSQDIPSEPLMNARENNAHYKQQQAAQIERNINLNNSQSLTQPNSATINQSHTNADNALKPITHDERAKSSAKSSKDSMRPQIQKTPNQPVSPVISAIPAVNSSPKPATPITFGNAEASWQKKPNTQLPPNLSRIVTLKQLSSLQVKLNVNAKGDVEKCRITQTSGDPEVDKFICQQVQKAKLYPKKANGITVPSIGNLTIALTNLAN